MAYEISRWQTKRLENLRIPVKAFSAGERPDWHPDEVQVVDLATMEVTMRCGCEQQIRGFLKDGKDGLDIEVTGLDMEGEGSGNFWHYSLEPALKRSTGHLEAVLIWEGGDSVSRFRVDDGVVSNEQIEL